MKNILLLIVTIIGFTHAYAVEMTLDSNAFSATGVISKKDKAFIIVKNGEATAMSEKDVVAYSLTADDGATVLFSTTQGAYPACIVAESIAAGQTGRCQVRGYGIAKINATEGAVTAGNFLIISNAGAGYVEGNAFTTTAALVYKPAGMALDTVSASGDVELFIDLL